MRLRLQGKRPLPPKTAKTGKLEDTAIGLYGLPGGDCTDISDLDSLDCNDDEGITELSTIEASGLTPGETYYVQVTGFGGDNKGSFCIEVYDPTQHFPENDNLCDAIPLVLGEYCEDVNGTTARATLEPGEPLANDCYGGGAHTVWYSFQAPASGNATITTETAIIGNIDDSAIGLYALPGGDCTDLSDLDSLDCNDDFCIKPVND